MKKIIAVNCSPRVNMNTADLVRCAAEGARIAGAEVEVVDLYRLGKFTGCISCFGCKLEPNKGKCICRDGLAELLEKIRTADGVILGSPNYLGDLTAGFRALFERLVYQHITYRREAMCNNDRLIPTLLIVTSNADNESYEGDGMNAAMLARYETQLSRYLGKTRTLIYGATQQVPDYSRFDWNTAIPEERRKRKEEVLPILRQQAQALGAQMAQGEW